MATKELSIAMTSNSDKRRHKRLIEYSYHYTFVTKTLSEQLPIDGKS